MTTHSFDTQIACRIGIEKAIILKEFQSIFEYKKNNDQNKYEDSYWFYYSSKGLQEKFPYMSERSISRWVLELEKDGYIKSSFLSDNPRDRTKWYSVTDLAYCICQIGESTLAKMANDIYEPSHSTPQSNNNSGNSEKKPSSIEERRVRFIETVRPYLKEYGQDMCDSFVDYWTEPTRDGKKMLFELKPTWSISGRLATWFKNSQNKRK